MTHHRTISRNRKTAFTLVEIMIVVLIIGILLAIAVPTWVSRRQEARATTIVKDLRAISDAKTRYIGETGQVSTASIDQTDLVPSYLRKWPEGPFKTPSDYVPNAGNVEPTYKGVTAETLQDPATRTAAITSLGL